MEANSSGISNIEQGMSNVEVDFVTSPASAILAVNGIWKNKAVLVLRGAYCVCSDLKKQSQFVTGKLGVSTYIRKDYKNRPWFGGGETKPIRNQLKPMARLWPARPMARPRRRMNHCAMTWLLTNCREPKPKKRSATIPIISSTRSLTFALLRFLRKFFGVIAS